MQRGPFTGTRINCLWWCDVMWKWGQNGQAKIQQGTTTKTARQKVLRMLHQLRREQASFCSGIIHERAGLSQHMSHRCMRRNLRQNGFRYLQSRKKGILTQKDYALRYNFARKMPKHPLEYWTIVFYLDRVGFAHKSNLAGEAHSTSSIGRNTAKG